jgi:hypothetical protein
VAGPGPEPASGLFIVRDFLDPETCTALIARIDQRRSAI